MIIINLVNTYELWYDGANYHDIRAAANAQFYGRLANLTTNRAVAEWALRQLDYANLAQDKTRAFKAQNHELHSTRTQEYIRHIHHECQEDIESRWQPELDSDTVGEILFEETLLRELEKIKPKQTDIKIDLL